MQTPPRCQNFAPSHAGGGLTRRLADMAPCVEGGNWFAIYGFVCWARSAGILHADEMAARTAVAASVHGLQNSESLVSPFSPALLSWIMMLELCRTRAAWLALHMPAALVFPHTKNKNESLMRRNLP